MTAKQYLIDKGLADSHWGKRIIEAEERGEFDVTDQDDAEDWVSCACGRLDGVARGPYGEPVDKPLRRRGMTFHECVAMDEFMGAAQTLVAIERRAAELLSTRSNP